MNGFGLKRLYVLRCELSERRRLNMKSLTAAMVCGLLLTHGFVIRAGSAQDARQPSAMPRIVLDAPILVNVKSQDVRWRGNVYNLVRIGKTTFHLDGQSRLTAKLAGGVTTFDNVEHEIHAAVFDGMGRLLGTAKAACPVERVWISKVLLEQREWPLDFGVSLAYADARSFTLTVNEQKVLTPEDWQKP
jgi:hypothetical protein